MGKLIHIKTVHTLLDVIEYYDIREDDSDKRILKRTHLTNGKEYEFRYTLGEFIKEHPNHDIIENWFDWSV